MYAVIRAGGKQHKVKAGDVIEVELMRSTQGDEVTFSPLLVVDDDGRTHYGKDIARAVVRARLVGEQKGEKIKVFKHRPKTRYTRRQGHRQIHTLLEIQDVALAESRTERRRTRTEAPATPSAAASDGPATDDAPGPQQG